MKTVIRPPAFWLIAICLFAGGCARKPEEPGVIRIIDRVSERHVLASPFRSPDPGNASLAEVAGKFPMRELGTGPNPFGIKMKLHLGPSDVNALAAAPPTTIAVDLRVPQDARFEFNYGIRSDDEVLRGGAEARNAVFSVVIATGGAEETLFRRSVRLEPRKALAFNSRTLDLSHYAGREVTLRLVTEGDERALAFWFSPLIYRVRRDARHVILISLDTLRSDHLGCYGYNRDTSPNIDLLARDGVRFAETRASSPWTLPSHLSMMTALDTINHGVATPELRLDPMTPTLAELLKAGGFYNAAFTGGGFVSGFYGFYKGFDSFRVLGEVADPDGAARLADKAVRWIEENADRDAFLFLHTYQIHNPYFAEEPWRRRYLRPEAPHDALDMSPLLFNHQNRFKPLPPQEVADIVGLYDGEIRYTDEALVGAVVAKLKGLGLYDRTMIVLTSDHGEEFREHGGWLHTHSVYEESVRVPLIVKLFDSRNAGRVVAAPARVVDILPTLAEELGLRLSVKGLDGRSLIGFADGRDGGADATARVGLSDLSSRMMGKHIPRKVAFFRRPYKLILNEPYTAEDLAYFLSPPPPLAEVEVFDVSHDPRETHNLAADRPDLVRELRDLVRERYKPRKRPGAERLEMSGDLVKELKTLGYL